jgi:seryl-tRNA(Sec) selenium transferase
MPVGMTISRSVTCREVCHVGLIHIGVGFDVARSTVMGNAKASECGTSNRTTLTLYFYISFISFLSPMP